MAFPTKKDQIIVETYTQARVTELVRLYSLAEDRLVAQIARASTTKWQRARAQAYLTQINTIIDDLNRNGRAWAKKTSEGVYIRKAEFVSQQFGKGKKGYLAFGNQIHQTTINILADDITLDLVTANESMRRQSRRFLRRMQVAQTADIAATEAIAIQQATGSTVATVAKDVLAGLQGQLLDGKLILINGRHYNATAYSRLVANTRTSEVASQATINTTLRMGGDLVKVSTHTTPDDICRDFQGRIYSLRGGDPRFPKATQLPPFHPNCGHTIFPITEPMLEEESPERLAELSAFSKSKVPTETTKEFRKALKAAA